MMSHNAARPLNRVALDPPAKGKDMTCLGFDHDMLLVDRALNPTRLIWAFEVSGDLTSVLNHLEIMGARLPIVPFRVEGPVPSHIGRRLLGWNLLSGRNSDSHCEHCKEDRPPHPSTVRHSHLRQPGPLEASAGPFRISPVNEITSSAQRQLELRKPGENGPCLSC